MLIRVSSADSFINTFNMTHPNKPLTPRVVIHHQKKQTKKRCTLKKEILIFGYVKNGQYGPKIRVELTHSLVLFWGNSVSWLGPFLNELCVAAWSFFEEIYIRIELTHSLVLF